MVTDHPFMERNQLKLQKNCFIYCANEKFHLCFLSQRIIFYYLVSIYFIGITVPDTYDLKDLLESKGINLKVCF